MTITMEQAKEIILKQIFKINELEEKLIDTTSSEDHWFKRYEQKSKEFEQREKENQNFQKRIRELEEENTKIKFSHTDEL